MTNAAIFADVEQWLPIPEWEGFYEASSYGRVRSIDRTITHSRGPKRLRGRILRPSINGAGYLSVFLSRKGVEIGKQIHNLIADTFVGMAPSGAKLEVCHNDGNKLNNCASNIRRDTRSGNFRDKRIHGTTFGENAPNVKLTKEAVKQIRSMKGTATQREIASMFGITQSNVSCIMLNKSWPAI